MKFLSVAMSMFLATSGSAFAIEPGLIADTESGRVYTDASGMTLYTFGKDKPGQSTCYDKCAVNWPPFIAEDGALEEGAWTLVDRKDGSRMWAYDGKPLYTFAKDENPGDVKGEGVGGRWHTVKAE